MGKAHRGPGQCSRGWFTVGIPIRASSTCNACCLAACGLPGKLLVPQSSVHPDSWISAQVDSSAVGKATSTKAPDCSSPSAS